RELFFDLTDSSSGVLSNTRSGGLKKDLSLLFENSDTTIAPEYTQADPLAPEPSIRPHSKDVLAEGAVLPRRPFASWPNMRHYYRMYREDTDTDLPVDWHIAQQPNRDQPENRTRDLSYSGGRVSTAVHVAYNIYEDSPDDNYVDTGNDRWFGQNSYQRFPILTRLLMINSYETVRYDERFRPLADQNDPNFEGIAFLLHTTPVLTYWNPYTIPLVIESNRLGVLADESATWPQGAWFYNLDGTPRLDWLNRQIATGSWNLDRPVGIANPDGSDIVFEPGELKVFSYEPGARIYRRGGDNTGTLRFVEGFDPSNPGGISDKEALKWKSVADSRGLDGDPAEMVIQFNWASLDNKDARNGLNGNTPGSLTVKMGSGSSGVGGIPPHYQIDWFQVSQQEQPITDKIPVLETFGEMLPIAYSALTLKGTSRISSDAPSWDWREDWRSRNWLHAPPYYYGSGLYMTEDSEERAHTQRLDSPYEVTFGPTSDSDLGQLIGEIGGRYWLGFGGNPREKVTAVPALELPTAPLSSLASFSGMRMNPGWIWSKDLNPDWAVASWRGTNNPGYIDAVYNKNNFPSFPRSLVYGGAKVFQYQSGITGGGIGNSFIHPMIPREEVYFFHNNSISQDALDLRGDNKMIVEPIDTKVYSDYWDHALMLNDALWDEYFISSIADQTRPWASESDNLQANIEALTTGDGLPISRYQYHSAGMDAADLQDKLTQEDAYLRAAEHLTVDGAFNVNSTSVKAWYALFKGIRERKLFFRDSTGDLSEVDVPDDHIALSRFDTATTDQEATDPEFGVSREDGNRAWSGVRFLDDDQIQLLAQKCVEQVKRRGPFLNFSEFINRRLEDSELGLMGALQSAIDYDDDSPDSDSINYRYKENNWMRMEESDLVGATADHEFPTPEAANGSRLAGIPGYVIQSDLLKPIANTLQVRDDTFRVRAYGESLDSEGNVIARAWCEAVIQRNPEYIDPDNEAYEPAFTYEADAPDGFDPRWDGEFVPNAELSPLNRKFGRKFEIVSFRWLNEDEV
ncbi:MAG TPA: hypothetical protein VJ952_00025, partial [Opitutales bacterium]|nr:hypothetical protein [Opitutales bacterium]